MSFALTRRAHLADDQVSGAQVITPQLRLRDIDILVADLVVAGPQEADAFAHDLQDAAAQLNALSLRFGLADEHGQGLFFQAPEIGNIQFLCHGPQLGERFVLQFKYFHVASLWGGSDMGKDKITQLPFRRLEWSL